MSDSLGVCRTVTPESISWYSHLSGLRTHVLLVLSDGVLNRVFPVGLEKRRGSTSSTCRLASLHVWIPHGSFMSMIFDGIFSIGRSCVFSLIDLGVTLPAADPKSEPKQDYEAWASSCDIIICDISTICDTGSLPCTLALVTFYLPTSLDTTFTFVNCW